MYTYSYIYIYTCANRSAGGGCVVAAGPCAWSSGRLRLYYYSNNNNNNIIIIINIM